jgi:hypothetical protein
MSLQPELSVGQLRSTKLGLYLAIPLIFIATCAGQTAKRKRAVTTGSQTVQCDKGATIAIQQDPAAVLRDEVICKNSTIAWTHLNNDGTSAGEFIVEFGPGEYPFLGPPMSIASANGKTQPYQVAAPPNGVIASFKYSLSVPPHVVVDPHIIVLGASTDDN